MVLFTGVPIPMQTNSNIDGRIKSKFSGNPKGWSKLFENFSKLSLSVKAFCFCATFLTFY